MADLLVRLVAIETETPPARNLGQCAEVLREHPGGRARGGGSADRSPSADRSAAAAENAGNPVLMFTHHRAVVLDQVVDDRVVMIGGYGRQHGIALGEYLSEESLTADVQRGPRFPSRL